MLVNVPGPINDEPSRCQQGFQRGAGFGFDRDVRHRLLPYKEPHSTTGNATLETSPLNSND